MKRFYLPSISQWQQKPELGRHQLEPFRPLIAALKQDEPSTSMLHRSNDPEDQHRMTACHLKKMLTDMPSTDQIKHILMLVLLVS